MKEQDVLDRKSITSLSVAGDAEDGEPLNILDELQNMQQTAIEMGTLIENIKGEGTQTVKQLEELCELIYECSVVLGQSEDISVKLEQLHNKIADTEQVLQSEILACNEAVFYISKATHWQYIAWYWKKLIKTGNTDIYIVPLPYYYKNMMEHVMHQKYEYNEIEKMVKNSIRQLKNKEAVSNIHVAGYEEFDVRLHHPDRIVIENPYDEWNQATTLPEKFYSRNLQKYTEQLVYIVPFQVEEFTKSQLCGIS